ncbi:MAG TPA: glycosyltransferase family 2 protein [Firmicutes bacterium]|nr:glycosyltransferase family 2 protein [Bacillota bacterium]
MLVSAIVPAYNEEGWVGKTVEALLKLPEICEVIVVDDGSIDKTALEALNAGAIVCRNSANRGKSQALRNGASIARGGMLAFVDADLKDSASEVSKLISPVMADEADMTVARFISSGKAGGMGLVKSLAYWSIRYYTGQKMLAPLSGQRVIKRSLWEAIDFKAEGFAAEVALTIESIKKGFRVKEVPVEMNHRVWGNDLRSFFHRGSQFFAVMKLLLQHNL